MDAAVSMQFEAIGTQWSIDIFTHASSVDLSAVRLRILSRIDEFDVTYSRFRPDSVVTAMSHKAGAYKLPPDSEVLLDLYYELYQLTDGLFTPLIGDVLSDAGYDSSYSLKSHRPLVSPPRLNEVILRTGPASIRLLKPCILDFGAAGKGYLVDIIGALLESCGVTGYCIDAGGDILHHDQSERSYRVGLENPRNTTEAIGVATIANQSICGSSGNRRRWGNYHHIMNPRTLISPRHIEAVWATAESGLIADAMTTALFFVDPEILDATHEFEYCIVASDMSVRISDGFTAEMFV